MLRKILKSILGSGSSNRNIEDIILALVENVIQTETVTMDIITIKKVAKKAFQFS